ncbi:MAG: VWA domain-containing protein [Desulfobacteraceae bacterium]|nr:MAG: VWA domain-containing protein [Desulfobacteraceae bacterium]
MLLREADSFSEEKKATMKSRVFESSDCAGGKAGGLPFKVIEFSRFLKSRGFKVFSSSVIDSLKSLELADISVREDFFSILRANLASTDMEWRLFPELFEGFWRFEEQKKDSEEDREKREKNAEAQKDLLQEILVPGEEGNKRVAVEKFPEKETLEGISYSPVSAVEKRDLGRFETCDIPVAQLLLKSMMSPFRVSVSRRFRKSRKAGDIDFRKIMKKGLKSEGIPLALLFKRKRKRLKRLVVVADVSGSMDRYARFVMPFLLGLKGIGTKAEVFVFSTSLTRISLIIRRSTLERVLRDIESHVPEWSGGTRIGYSLRQLNEQYGKRFLTRRSVAVIMSDGWDLGAKNLLKKEMETISGSVHSVLWLNPMIGDSQYGFVSKAMEMVLPYVDHLLPADNLQSLKRVGRTLSKVMGQ